MAFAEISKSTSAVDVRIIAPGPLLGSHVVRKASGSQWDEPFAAGAEIHAY